MKHIIIRNEQGILLDMPLLAEGQEAQAIVIYNTLLKNLPISADLKVYLR